ncbi:MAG: hypothetical protein ACRDLF_04210 [Solirubrobacteraceae bacterium]
MDAGGNAVMVWNWGHDSIETSFRLGMDGLWDEPMSLPSVGTHPRVALNAKGDAVAVWSSIGGLWAATKRSGSGVWQAPVDVSDTSTWANEPQIAIDGQGDAVAVWTEYKGPDWVLHAAVKPASAGVWGPAVQLSPEGSSASYPQVAMDERGDAIVAWRAPSFVQAVTGSGSVAGGGWQAPVIVSGAGEEIGEALQVALDARGDAVAVWDRWGHSGMTVVSATRPGSGGGWRPPVQLSASGGWAVHPGLAVDGQGQAIAVWEVSTPEEINVQAVFGSIDVGAWQAPAKLATTSRERAPECSGTGCDRAPGPPPAEPRVAMNAQGDVVAVWDSNGPAGRRIIQAALRSPGASAWQVPVDLSAAGASGPRVALDAQGDAVAVWTKSSGELPIVQADTLASRLMIADASLSNVRLRVSGRRSGTSRRVRYMTHIRFVLSAPARLQITIVRREPGVRRGRRCASARIGVAQKAKRCTRRLTLGVLENTPEPRGINSLPFDGHLARCALKPGTYEAVLIAHDHNEHSATVILPFTILQ